MDEGGGTMTEEEVMVAEAPEDTDAGESRIAGGLDIDITITDIYGMLFANTQLAQCLVDGVRGRLLADALCLMFPNSDFYLWKEMAYQFLGRWHELITDNGKVTATTV